MNHQSHQEYMKQLYQENLEKVRECIDQGHLWKARDRCMGMIGHQPYREEICRLAAEIYYKMGDYPRAGVYYLVTQDDSEEARQCIDCAIREYGASLPRQYRKKVARANLPRPIVKQMDKQLKRAGVKNGILGLRSNTDLGKATCESSFKVRWGKRAIFVGCFFLLAIAGFLLVYGLIRLLMDIFSFWG